MTFACMLSTRCRAPSKGSRCIFNVDSRSWGKISQLYAKTLTHLQKHRMMAPSRLRLLKQSAHLSLTKTNQNTSCCSLHHAILSSGVHLRQSGLYPVSASLCKSPHKAAQQCFTSCSTADSPWTMPAADSSNLMLMAAYSRLRKRFKKKNNGTAQCPKTEPVLPTAPG